MLSAKKLRYYIIAAILLGGLAVTIIEIPIITSGLVSRPQPSDTMIVLGAKLIGRDPSAILRLRLEEAVKLYQQGYAPTIIVSGARGKDEEVSEAEAMRLYLIARGIDPRQILIEDKSYNTYQNLLNSRSLMYTHGLSSAIIVSNASHMRRALLLAGQLGITASGAPAPMVNNSYLTAKQYLREGAATLAAIIRDI